MNSVYQNKVELLLRLLPFVMDEGVFAVHGGSAINLFVKDMPRYSVDIDLTYMPLAGREESLNDINAHLKAIAEKAKVRIPGLHVVPNYATCKLLCEWKLVNLAKLKKQNPEKMEAEVEKLRRCW